RMSLYQMVYLDRVPVHAAVSEAVEIAKRRGHPGIAGMVNGVLRAAARGRAELTLPEDDAMPPAARLALKHSYPEWLAARWIEAFGEPEAEAIMAAGNEPPKSSIRVNRLRNGRRSVME